MGDRGNIVIEADNDCFPAPLFMYTHWDGSNLKGTLQAALKRGTGRWDDPSYLARIIFSEMIRNSIESDIGYGLSTTITDNNHDLLCVNMKERTVRVRKWDWKLRETERDPLKGKVLHKWTFDEFCALALE